MAVNILDTYVIRLDIDTSAIDKKLGVAQKKIEGLDKGSKAGKSSGSAGISSGAAIGAGAGAGMMSGRNLGIAASVTAAIGFLTNARKEAVEFSTAQEKAITALRATEEQQAALENQARTLGKTTIYTALEVSQAQEMLGKNGITFQQAMDGMVKSSLTLSGALSTDLSSSADLLTDAMVQFNVEASESSHVVDMIAGTAANSKAKFRDLRLAFAQGGGAAGKLGVELDDFLATIAGTISAFGSGSDAGTAYKTFLTRLVPTSKKAAELQKELGLEFFDSAGNMKGMADIADQLNSAFKGLSEEERTFAAKELFGDDAMRMALSLSAMTKQNFQDMKAGVKSVDAYQYAIGQLGDEERNILLLKSAFSELKIKLANDLGINRLFTEGTAALTGFINLINSVPPDILKVTATLVGLRLGAGLLSRVLGGRLTSGIKKAAGTMLRLGGKGGAIAVTRAALVGLGRLALGSNPLGWVITAGIMVYQYWDKIPALFDYVAEKMEKVRDVALSAMESVGEFLGMSDDDTGLRERHAQMATRGAGAVSPSGRPISSQQNQIEIHYNLQGTDYATVREASRQGIDDGLAGVGAH